MLPGLVAFHRLTKAHRAMRVRATETEQRPSSTVPTTAHAMLRRIYKRRRRLRKEVYILDRLAGVGSPGVHRRARRGPQRTLPAVPQAYALATPAQEGKG